MEKKSIFTVKLGYNWEKRAEKAKNRAKIRAGLGLDFLSAFRAPIADLRASWLCLYLATESQMGRQELEEIRIKAKVRKFWQKGEYFRKLETVHGTFARLAIYLMVRCCFWVPWLAFCAI